MGEIDTRAGDAGWLRGRGTVVNAWRLLAFGCAAAIVVLVGYGAAVAGIALCDPPPLAGDEMWAWSARLREALSLVSGERPRACFNENSGSIAVAAAGWAGPLALVILMAGAIWEAGGLRLRQMVRRRWGGHAILAGDEPTLRGLAAAEARQSGLVFVVLDRQEAHELQRWRPTREVALLGDRSCAAALLSGLGMRTARLIAAATDSDLANLALCQAALDAGVRAELLLRLEQPSVRALGSQPLRRLAGAARVTLTTVSLTQMQVRRGLSVAMPGRYRNDRATRTHIIVCGSGFGIQEAAFNIARQGYGLECAIPLLTVIRTGQTDFAAGALDRLAAASDAVEVSVSAADASNYLALDRAMASAVLNGGPPAAIHCLGERPEEAETLAARWEQVLLDLDLHLPPIVAYGVRTPIGRTGMIRTAGRIDLAEAGALSRIADRRARLCHEHYLAGQRRARGDAFGTHPAEVDWADLEDGLQDDNRNLADHLDFKLASAGLLSGPRDGNRLTMTAAEVEALAPVEHARWQASKVVSGWRLGAVRDDGLLHHQDLRPYAELDEDARRKDRTEIEAMPALLALGDEGLVRERPVGLASSTDATPDIAAIVSGLSSHAVVTNGAPVLAMPLGADGLMDLAESVLAAGIRLEIVQDRPVHIGQSGAQLRRVADILRQAHRIRIVADGTAAAAIEAGWAHTIDGQGRVRYHVPA